jgi:hypothetical protein
VKNLKLQVQDPLLSLCVCVWSDARGHRVEKLNCLLLFMACSLTFAFASVERGASEAFMGRVCPS